jgi:hypothetical protein
VFSSAGLAFRSARQSRTANTCPSGIDPVDADRVTSRPICRLLVRAAICRQHGRRHPASVTYSHPSLSGPGTDLRIAGRSRRSSSPRSSRPTCTGTPHACSRPRLRARRPRPRLRRGLMCRLARLLPVLGKAERDPIQGAENADCVLKGFTGIDGDLQSIPSAWPRWPPSSARDRRAIAYATSKESPLPRTDRHPEGSRPRSHCPLRHMIICRCASALAPALAVLPTIAPAGRSLERAARGPADVRGGTWPEAFDV